MRQPKYNHAWWMRYIEDWKTTDKSVSEYCKEYNLSTTAFYLLYIQVLTISSIKRKSKHRFT